MNAYSTVAPRERREQIQDRTMVEFQYDWNRWFIRPTASLLDYDMMTEQFNVTGYQNYESRYDVNGGPDLGYKINASLAMTLGYRYGHQYQDCLLYTSPVLAENWPRLAVPRIVPPRTSKPSSAL